MTLLSQPRDKIVLLLALQQSCKQANLCCFRGIEILLRHAFTKKLSTHVDRIRRPFRVEIKNSKLCRKLANCLESEASKKLKQIQKSLTRIRDTRGRHGACNLGKHMLGNFPQACLGIKTICQRSVASEETLFSKLRQC